MRQPTDLAPDHRHLSPQTASLTQANSAGENTIAQTSPDVLADRIGAYVLDQLGPQERDLACAHVREVAAALATTPRDALVALASRRAAEADALAGLYQARAQAFVAQNQMSTALVKALRAFDQLAGNAHRRAQDWLEVLERARRPRAATVTIGEAHQVAVMVGDDAEVP